MAGTLFENALRTVHAELPPLASANLTIEDQARTVLHLLTPSEVPSEVVENDATRCPNCDAPCASLASPYCSKACRDQASWVRQMRVALASGSILDSEKQVVFGERLWWLLGGGLPMRESRLTESGKRQVIKRCEGKCEYCGAPMALIENHGSGCNRPFNLRAMCEKCAKTKAFMDPEFAARVDVTELLGELSRRIFAVAALRPCDDAESWDWRAFLAQRKSNK